jgi:hypothetical protein
MSSDDERRVPAAVQLKAKLRRHDGGMRMYLTETMYHVQVDYTCDLLGAVDEVTDAGTAARIVDAIYERLTRGAVSAAKERQWDAREQYEALMRYVTPREPVPPSG